jgi:exosortase A
MEKTGNQYASHDGSGSASSWWRAMGVLCLLLAWTLFLYRDTAIAIETIWLRSETFTHGFIVPPIVAWLIWRQRRAIAALTPQASWGALPAVLIAVLAWLLGDLVAVNSVTQLAFVSLLVLSVPAVLGLAVTRLIIFPLAFLYFAVPIGEFLMPLLMDWTADFTVVALRLTGIPVYREGLMFVIPSGNWSVVEACSGVRYLIASLTVGTLFAYLNYTSAKRRLLFVAVSIVVPVIANWMRAYFIVLLGHLSSNKLATGVDHLIYGWIFFGAVVLLMFFIGARWAEPMPSFTASDVVPLQARQPASSVRAWGAAALFLVLISLPQAVLWNIARLENLDAVQLPEVNFTASGWLPGASGPVGFKPAFHDPSAEINRSFSLNGGQVGLYLGYYRNQDYNRKLVSSDNVLVTSNDREWAQVATGSQSVMIDGMAVTVRTAELRLVQSVASAQDGRLIVWQLYWINGTVTSNPYLAKIYGAWHRLMGQGDDSSVIIAYTPKDADGAAPKVLESFFTANFKAIDQVLATARQRR